MCALAAAFALAAAVPAAAQPSNNAVTADFSAFQIIAQRNIFDPNRYPRYQQNYRRTSSRSAPTFSLVGAMSYRKGMFAFFDGTDPDYQKAIQAGGDIAGYTVTNITLNGVQLATNGQTINLKVGAAMRLEGDSWVLNQPGDWTESSSGGGESISPQETPAPSPGAGGGEVNDVLKRLMQLRQQEEK